MNQNSTSASKDKLNLLTAVFQSFDQAMCCLDAQGNITLCNSAFSSLLGYADNELTGQHWDVCLLTAQSSNVSNASFDCLRPMQVTCYLSRHDGSSINVTLTVKSVNLDGVPQWIVTVLSQGEIVDYSTQIQACIPSAHQSIQHQLLLHNIREGMMVLVNDRIVFGNAKLFVLSGCDESELIGTPFINIVHPDDRKMVMDLHQRRMRGEQIDGIYRARLLQQPIAITIWVEFTSKKIAWEGGSAILTLMSDITERKSIED